MLRELIMLLVGAAVDGVRSALAPKRVDKTPIRGSGLEARRDALKKELEELRRKEKQ